MRTTKTTVITLDDGDEITIRYGGLDVSVIARPETPDSQAHLSLHTDDVVWMDGTPEGEVTQGSGSTLLSEGDVTITVI